MMKRCSECRNLDTEGDFWAYVTVILASAGAQITTRFLYQCRGCKRVIMVDDENAVYGEGTI